MRIAFCSHEIGGPGKYGGVGRYLRTIIEGLVDRGHDVHVLLPGTITSRYDVAGAHIQTIPVRQESLPTAGDDIHFLLAAEHWLRRVQPDVLHIQHLLGIPASVPQLAYRLGIPYVMHVHDGASLCVNAHFHRIVGGTLEPCCTSPADDGCISTLVATYGISREAARQHLEERRNAGRANHAHAAAAIFASDDLKQRFVHDFGWTSANDMVLAPALDWPHAVPSSAQTPDRVTRFGLFGLLTPIKGAERVVTAFRDVTEDAELHIHGEIFQARGDGYGGRLAELVADDKRIIVHGAYRPDELSERFAGVDWLVVGSHYESGPFVVDEARSCGVPTIAFAVGGIPTKLAQGGGLLVEPDDVAALAETMRRACNPQLRQNVRAAITKPASLAAQLDALLRIYRDVVDSACAPPDLPAADGICLLTADAGRATTEREIVGTSEQWYLRTLATANLNRAFRDTQMPLVYVAETSSLLPDLGTIARWRAHVQTTAATKLLAGAIRRHDTVATWRVEGGWLFDRNDILAAGGLADDLDLSWGTDEKEDSLEVADGTGRAGGQPLADPTEMDPFYAAAGIVPELTSIVILAHNELAMTQRCIESIAQHTHVAYELVLVDNGSNDGTLEYFGQVPHARVIHNAHNVGFGAGCNMGMAEARGSRVCLLNNDTVVTDGWLAGLHAALDADPTIGIAAPRTNCIVGSQELGAIGYDHTSLEGLQTWAAARARQRHGHGFKLLRAVGFCLLLRRRLIDTIGGFDLRYACGNFEDDDLCLRAQVAGFGCWVAEDVFVHHEGSRTFLGAGLSHAASMQANFLQFAQKWDLQAPRVSETSTQPSSYNAARIIAHHDFVPRRHYSPLVGRLQDEVAVTVPGRAVTLLLSHPDVEVEGFVRAFAACMAAFDGSDDLTLVVRVTPGDEQRIEQMERLLDAQSPAHDAVDIVLMELPDTIHSSLIRACDFVLCAGATAAHQASAARALGRAPISVNALNQLCDTLMQRSA